ncbi:hypothetical protein CLU96_4098 [Chryseobacterium sp. 52]|uniref:hypothetical protein n=1 Tax=Chryseobacterium sp. 52 TaxID=2035213 RepID=UPI000C69E684|nr:hypothetical protein [Chryseobacterium sp. 52]PIF47052.1 hypothetical protein CLU96_4098 [Chryseobacterium sp. 52]
MKKIILLVMVASGVLSYGQEKQVLKTEKLTKTSMMERRIPEKSNDSIAKNNMGSIFTQKNNSSSIFGNANRYETEVQLNVNKLQNNVNTFNNNTFNRMMPQGQGLQIYKSK